MSARSRAPQHASPRRHGHPGERGDLLMDAAILAVVVSAALAALAVLLALI
jgi:hypothetical protein